MSALFERATGWTLRDPQFLWLALLVPLALLVRRREPAVPLASLSFWAPVRTLRGVLRPLPTWLQIVGILLMAVALARPAAREALPAESEGIDVLLCLDVSSSMTRTDLDPARTRLDVARDAAIEFVRGRPEDRIGLVTFARYPDLGCPLTRDHDALAQILAGVETVAADGPEDATGFGAAVARAAQVLEAAGTRSRVVILLTDGEENVGVEGARAEIPPVHAAQLAERLGVRVYAIAAGVHRQDGAGGLVKLDTRPLEHIAARTRGAFFAPRDAEAIAGVYERIDRLEKAPFEEPRFVFADRFLVVLASALASMLAGCLLGASWLGVVP